MKIEPERCPTCHRRIKRSNPQNNRYWAILGAIAQKLTPKGNAYSLDAWHEFMKRQFLGATETTLPNGTTLIRGNSSAELGKDEFNEFMEQVEAFAAEHDVYLDELVAR